MKVRIGDIIKHLEQLKIKTSIFNGNAGKVLINNKNAKDFQLNIRTGNFWRAEISEQANLETIGKKVIYCLASDLYANKCEINVPDKFVTDWTISAFECAAMPRCISVIDDFEKCDFLKPKLSNIMNNKFLVFKAYKQLPRKIILEMAGALLEFDKHYRQNMRGVSYMNNSGIIFQHGFVMDSDPEQVILKEYWNSTIDAAGMAQIISVMSEEEFTGREKAFSF